MSMPAATSSEPCSRREPQRRWRGFHEGCHEGRLEDWAGVRTPVEDGLEVDCSSQQQGCPSKRRLRHARKACWRVFYA